MTPPNSSDDRSPEIVGSLADRASTMSANPLNGPWHFEPHGMFGSDDLGGDWPLGYISTDTPQPIFEIKPILEWPTEELVAAALKMAAAPSLYSDAEFLCARIRELEGALSDDSEAARDYFGHVVPAVARMESALAEARGQ